MSATTDWLTAISGLGAAGAATIGLAYAGIQLRASRSAADATRKTNESAFLLTLEDQFRHHWNVHLALRGGDWSGAEQGPESNEEWARVESYMGLFERLNILNRNEVLSLQYIEQFYGYRLRNVWANEIIRVEKLCKRASGWRDFIELSDKLGITRVPCPETE